MKTKTVLRIIHIHGDQEWVDETIKNSLLERKPNRQYNTPNEKGCITEIHRMEKEEEK